jgi:alkanesulfonate monooxygenase SsuD/methylene tetrahydromethanopterin reductase-like flavin-dependent oxidoreductase (luciferase family)
MGQGSRALGTETLGTEALGTEALGTGALGTGALGAEVRGIRPPASGRIAGRRFGSRWAEVIFTAQPLLPVAQEFYADMKSRLASHGRTPDQLHILPGLMPIVAETEAEARDLLAARQAGQDGSAKRMSEMVGFDLSALPQDEPIPPSVLPERGTTNGMRGRADLYLDLIRRHGLTPRQVLAQNAHLAFAGTPLQTADLITEWFAGHACDGFTLMWPSIAANRLFVDKVVPLLQERGLYRTAYRGNTLREHFGFSRPPGRRG